MPQTDLYTIVFKKNGKVITKANGGDIIDVELYSTNPAFTRSQQKEISNFNFDVAGGDDLEFSNCSYVNDSITNSQGIVPLPADQKTDNGFMKTHIGVFPRISLTDIIKFQIKLADANNFSNKTAKITTLTALGFRFSNGDSNNKKSFKLKIKPKFTTTEAALAAGISLIVVNSVFNSNNSNNEN